MAVIFPSGIQPFIFSDTLPAGTDETTQAALDQHITAFHVAEFSAAVPPGATRLVVTFVVFAYPTPRDLVPKSPPIVELLGRSTSFNEPAATLRQTPDGTASATIAPGQFVNYSYRPLSPGVFQIVLTPNNVPFDAVRWQLRFTINDGVTSSQAQLGLTFTVGTDDAGVGWLAVPGQAALSPAGPAPIDVGGALDGITLAGAHPADPAHTLPAGQPATVAIPLANYGPGPLTISACTSPAAGHFAIAFPAPMILQPGGRGSVTLTYQSPDGGENQSPAEATIFTLLSDDPLAAPSGTSAHCNTLAFYARSIPVPSLTRLFPPRGVPPVELDDGETLICEIAVFGNNLNVANVSASFGDVPAETIRFTPLGHLILGVPDIPPGRVPVTVTTPGGTVTSTDLFTVSLHPEISDLNPFTFGDHGDSPAGRPFAILGSRFIIEPGDTVQANAVLKARSDGIHQIPDLFIVLQIVTATESRLDVKAGPAPNFDRYVGGTVTIRVDRSDGGAAESTNQIVGL